MRKIQITAVLLLISCTIHAQDKKEITKTGWNLGPLPAIAYDADKGFQVGAILQLFDYGDGTVYPNYKSKAYMEFSYFTKGSMLIQARYDAKELIPGVRWSNALRVNLDNAFDFYGFNGYQSYYDFDRVKSGKDGSAFLFTPFYRYSKKECLFKSDFIGEIADKIHWEVGIFANYFKLSPIDYGNINRNKSETQLYPTTMPTLYELYHRSGVISDSEYNGGFSSGIRLGMVYDTRDKEGAPSRGIWAEAHTTLAPGFLGKNPFYRYSLTWRHYVPIMKDDILTFAYRLNYEGNFGKKAPFYALSYMTVMGEKCDLEGMGGYFTTRGILRTRVLGLDMASYNIELRGRFARFVLWNQNIALGLSAFSDGAVVTRGIDISPLKEYVKQYCPTADYNARLKTDISRDIPHVTFGAGFRFIMNENFIVCAEYGMPLSHLLKNSPIHNQDGNGALYINVGYLF